MKDFNDTQLAKFIKKYSFKNSDELSPASDLESDLGLDSLDKIELLMDIENQYNIETLSDDDLYTIKSIQDIIDYLEKNNVSHNYL